MTPEFKPFPKIPRLFRECIVTEKLDGTNASVHIGEDGVMLFGSRNQWITPERDNYGFAKWATDHADELRTLGLGTHFGEWWGGGIQRGYGLKGDDKRFSLFNVQRWCLHGQAPAVTKSKDPRIPDRAQGILPPCVGLVPVLSSGEPFHTGIVEVWVDYLRVWGSRAVPGFMRPEGIVVYHVASGHSFKVTLENDNEPKSK